jgi:hypothetical protein
MNYTAYLSALAALFGSAIGGLTSLATTWLTQHGQWKYQQLTRDRVKREELFAEFIFEASQLYADAFEHDSTDISRLSKLFTLISRMRILTSKDIVDHADRVSNLIIDTYLAPNRTFKDIVEIRASRALDPLREFAEACREELRKFTA